MSAKELEALKSRAPALKQKIEEKNKEVAARISHTYAEASRALSNALAYTICAGLLMIERKEELPHGEFGPWLQKYCPEISWDSAGRFMNATRSAVAAVLGDEMAKGEISDNCKCDGAPLHSVLMADPATLTKAARDVQNQFRDFLAGKTQHQLLLDWKEIKDPAQGRKPAKQLTASEVAAAEARQADEKLAMLIADIRLFVLGGPTLQHASDHAKKDLLECGIEMNNRLREVIASNGRKGKKA